MQAIEDWLSIWFIMAFVAIALGVTVGGIIKLCQTRFSFSLQWVWSEIIDWGKALVSSAIFAVFLAGIILIWPVSVFWGMREYLKGMGFIAEKEQS